MIILGIIVCLFWAGLNPTTSHAADLSNDMDFSTIEQYILAEMKQSNLPGLSISIVKNDQIVFLQGYGRADPSGRAATGQTPFIIGSVTKSFTALPVMQLVEVGKIELDAPVQKYLPWFRIAGPEASKQVTVRHLLNQTSGISQTAAMETMTWTGTSDRALEEHVRYLAGVKLNRTIGSSYEYSNANYITLGLVVQTVSGQSYESYVKEHIFAPLNMRNSYVSQDEALQNGMASGYRWWFGVPFAVTLPYNRGDLPAGYVISSAEDMGHFLIAQMNGGRYGNTSVLSPEGVDLMHTEPLPDTSGMGWFLEEVEGHTFIGHDGGSFNFQSAMFYDPQEHVGVFIVANVIGMLDVFSSPLGQTALRMTKRILSLAVGAALPEQGMGIGKAYRILDGVILFLTALLVLTLTRISVRYSRLAQKGFRSKSGFVWRVILIVVLHFLWPLGLLYLILVVPAWQVTVAMQPDLGYWLDLVALIVFAKGVIEIVMSRRVFKQSR